MHGGHSHWGVPSSDFADSDALQTHPEIMCICDQSNWHTINHYRREARSGQVRQYWDPERAQGSWAYIWGGLMRQSGHSPGQRYRSLNGVVSGSSNVSQTLSSSLNKKEGLEKEPRIRGVAKGGKERGPHCSRQGWTFNRTYLECSDGRLHEVRFALNKHTQEGEGRVLWLVSFGTPKAASTELGHEGSGETIHFSPSVVRQLTLLAVIRSL